MRDLRSFVLSPFFVPSLNRRCRPSCLALVLLGIMLTQGNGKMAIAQSIPVLPPVVPANVDDLDDLDGVDESLELDESLDSDLNDPLVDEPLVDELENLDLPEDDLPEAPSVDEIDVDELDIDEPSVDELDIEEPSIDELDIDGLDVDGLDIEDLPLNDILNGDENPSAFPSENNVVPAPTQPVPFKPSQGSQIFEDVVLTPGRITNPTTLRGISGGPLTASSVAGRTDTVTGICTGFVDQNPDHQIELTEFFDYLSLQVESPEDTVLVVRGPGGSWCNDDVLGFNPGLAGEWFSGVYDVWVGSYNEQTYHPYIIRLSDSQ